MYRLTRTPENAASMVKILTTTLAIATQANTAPKVTVAVLHPGETALQTVSGLSTFFESDSVEKTDEQKGKR